LCSERKHQLPPTDKQLATGINIQQQHVPPQPSLPHPPVLQQLVPSRLTHLRSWSPSFLQHLIWQLTTTYRPALISWKCSKFNPHQHSGLGWMVNGISISHTTVGKLFQDSGCFIVPATSVRAHA
jgi:hypothetical protein